MKRGLVFEIVLGLLIVIFLINPVYAGFVLGNKSYDITTTYAPGEKITGWINISFQNENSGSSFNAFESNISLISFLKNNSASYTCIPANCEKGYSYSNPQSSKSLNLAYMNQKIIGVKLTGQISSINSFYFNLSTNAGKSCQNPLKIDVLNDNLIEWKSDAASDDFSCLFPSPYGCYNEADALDQVAITPTNNYCERINLPIARKIKIGANVNGVGNAQFKMSIDIGTDNKECIANAAGSGEISCIIDFGADISEPVEASVCIEKNSGTEYTIKYENVNPCGYSDDYAYDFPLFIKIAKYSEISSVDFNSALVDSYSGINLAEEIQDYLDSEYSSNCTNGCIIPIKIYSGINQDINISSLGLNYNSGGLPKSEVQIYDLIESNPTINTGFLKLSLEKANFLVPLNYGNKTFSLKLNNSVVLEKDIDIKNVPKILDILPQEVPAVVSNPFIVLLEGSSANLTYSWDFGDNSTKQITNTNTIFHSYPKIGTYTLSLTVSNKIGNSTKSVSVKVGSPKDYINSTINSYLQNLNKIQAEINKTPSWIQNRIKKQFDVEALKSSINTQKSKYDAAFSDSDYVKIMEALVALNIPDSFNTSYKINPSPFVPSPEEINLPALDYFGTGSVEGTEEDYKKAVTNWFIKGLEGKIESTTYSLYSNGNPKELISYVKITLTSKPEQHLGEIYFLINGNPANITINTEKTIKEYEDASGIIIPELTGSETIEFLYPGKISIESIPVYLSPEFKNLEISVEPGICNFNKKCEPGLKENYKNCRSDCKPVGLTTLWIFILLFVALCIYVALQEWYKRHYENNLFSNKNQLFNLINFINTSNNQGMRKSDIFDKLKDLGWSGEQLTYAWNKFQGKRTGMWEIPIFKFIEKRQVREELEKRGSQINPLQKFRRV